MDIEGTLIKTRIAPTKIDVLWVVRPELADTIGDIRARRNEDDIFYKACQTFRYMRVAILPAQTFDAETFEAAVREHCPRWAVIAPEVQCDLAGIKSGELAFCVEREHKLHQAAPAAKAAAAPVSGYRAISKNERRV